MSAQNAVAPVPHGVSGAPQLAWQLPEAQTRPAEHAVPHVPQFWLSLLVLVQMLEEPASHRVEGAAQPEEQVPPTQS